MHTPFRHPLASHAAGTVLGYRRDGRPIYPIAGGNGEGEGATATDSGASNDAGQQGVSTAQTAADGQQQTAVSTQQGAAGLSTDAGADLAATVARLEKQLADARKDAGAARVNAKAQAAEEAKAELAQQIGRALGLVRDDTPPDPAELTKQITAQTGRIGDLESSLRAKEVELAVHAAAERQQAKAGALLDSRSFVKAIRELDPTATDFTTQLDAAIKAAVDANPQYRVMPQAARSGADLTGGSGETGTTRRNTLGAAISGHYQT